MSTPPLLLLAEGRRPRARKAAVYAPKEIVLHVAVADTLRRFVKPDWRWAHYPAGELRQPRTAAKLRAMGVQRGWPDVMLLSPNRGQLFALELKRLGEDLTEAQRDFQTWAIANGVPYAVAWTIDEALAILNAWGCLRLKIGGAV